MSPVHCDAIGRSQCTTPVTPAVFPLGPPLPFVIVWHPWLMEKLTDGGVSWVATVSLAPPNEPPHPAAALLSRLENCSKWSTSACPIEGSCVRCRFAARNSRDRQRYTDTLAAGSLGRYNPLWHCRPRAPIDLPFTDIPLTHFRVHTVLASQSKPDRDYLWCSYHQPRVLVGKSHIYQFCYLQLSFPWSTARNVSVLFWEHQNSTWMVI